MRPGAAGSVGTCSSRIVLLDAEVHMVCIKNLVNLELDLLNNIVLM